MKDFLLLSMVAWEPVLIFGLSSKVSWMLFVVATLGMSLMILSLLRKPIDCSKRSREMRRVFGRAALGLSSMESLGVPFAFL